MESELDKEVKRILILDDIRSAHNVGSIFRTADAVGIDKIYLGGYTPAPIDRFGRKRNDISKASLGAEDSVDWEVCANSVELVEKLKEEGFQVIALEQNEKSIDYRKIDTKERVAIILGREVEGVDSKLLHISDVIAEIPMMGKKESLNVSVATGVFLFSIFKI